MELNLGEAFSASLEKVGGWVESLIQSLPNVLAALVVLLFFWIVARLAQSGIRRAMDSATDHGPVKSLIATVVYVAVLGVGAMAALGVLGLDDTVTSLLAGVGIIGLALGFAFQDTAENFISGVFLSVRRPFTDGDLIETGDYMGIVEDVNLRSTIIRSLTGQLVRVPNSEVYGSALVNYSATGSRRVDVACGVTYGDDLEEAGRVALEAIRGVEGRDESKEPELFWQAFGGSSIDFVVHFWIPFRASNATWLQARSDAMVRLKKALDAAGVGIPFPIVTLDFGDVGGRRLKEELRVLGAAEGGRAGPPD